MSRSHYKDLERCWDRRIRAGLGDVGLALHGSKQASTQQKQKSEKEKEKHCTSQIDPSSMRQIQSFEDIRPLREVLDIEHRMTCFVHRISSSSCSESKHLLTRQLNTM